MNSPDLKFKCRLDTGSVAKTLAQNKVSYYFYIYGTTVRTGRNGATMSRVDLFTAVNTITVCQAELLF